MICREEMPQTLADAINHAYEELGKKLNEEKSVQSSGSFWSNMKTYQTQALQTNKIRIR